MIEPHETRRYDLDWLRVILFGILVPYHALIGFVSYGADVYGYRNQHIAGDAAELIIFILHAWRLPALFLISGVGTYFLTRRRGAFAFVSNRVIRILIPLIIGVLFWNAIIAYYQLATQGPVPPFLQFWWDRLPNLSLFRTGHLWFLANLFCYSILALPLFRASLKFPASQINRLLPLAAGLVILWAALWVKPQGSLFPYFISWTTVIYGMYYILGFWLMTTRVAIWPALARLRYVALICAITSVAILGMFLAATQGDTATMNLMINGNWLATDAPRLSVRNTSYSALYAANTLFWCMAIFGFGHHHLNRPNRLLPALNRAVYPFYIFHMVVVFVGLYYLRTVPWPWFVEFLILTFGTYIVTALIYLFFDAIPPLRPLVGLSLRKNKRLKTFT